MKLLKKFIVFAVVFTMFHGTQGFGLNNQGFIVQAASVEKTASDLTANKPATEPASDGTAVIGVNNDKKITRNDIETAIVRASANKTIKEVPSAATGVTIVLDPGHGGSDPGAICMDSNGNVVNEKDLNWKIAEYTKAELETYAGVTVGLTREESEYVRIIDRAIRAETFIIDHPGAENILVSLHNNASTSETA